MEKELSQDEIWEIYKSGGPKPATMADKEWELGMNHYLYDQNSQLLKNNLATQQSAAAQRQKAAQQGASINNDKIMRYLGVRNAEAGIGSLQTSSDAVRANNNYMQNRAAINTDFSQQQNDLLEFYATGNMENLTRKMNADTATRDKWRLLDEERQRANYEHVEDLLKKYTDNALSNDGIIDEEEMSDIDKLYEDLMARYDLGNAGYEMTLKDWLNFNKDTGGAGSKANQSTSKSAGLDASAVTVEHSGINREGSNSGSGNIKDNAWHSGTVSYNGDSTEFKRIKTTHVTDSSLPTFGGSTTYYMKGDKIYLYDGKSRSNYEITKDKDTKKLESFLKDNNLVVS